MRQRALHLLKWLGVFCLLGAAYAVFVRLTGYGIPCPIHSLTGLYCPGCGISRFCLALLRLDFPAALRSNMALFLMLPLGAAVLAGYAVHYIRTGDRRLSRWQNVLVWVMIGGLLLFGVLRNIPALGFLAPA